MNQYSQNQNSQNSYSQSNVRQISQEEIDRARGLSQEELQRTQVLNLKDVEEVASFERRTSKKPAIIIAVIGALMILFGSTFSVVQSMTAKKVNEQKTVQKRKIDKTTDNQAKVEQSYLNCTATAPNLPDGTDIIYTIKYTFDNITNSRKCCWSRNNKSICRRI